MSNRTRVRYGPHRAQFGVLSTPTIRVDANPSTPRPTVVLLHGGFWRWPYNRWLMGRLVRSVLAHGWSAFNVEYRRLGRFGGGGGWPNTFDDARDAIDAIAVHQRNASADADQCGPIIVVGHSAGGHLALWAAAHTAARVAGVVALAAPSDLETLSREGSEPVDRLVAGATIDDRWRSTSPRRMLPLGVPIACIHGEHDATIDPAMSAAFVGAARAAGDDAEFRLIAGERHRDALRPTSRTWAAALRFVEGWTSERSPSGVHSSC